MTGVLHLICNNAGFLTTRQLPQSITVKDEGITIALRKFQTSGEDTLLRGLYLIKVPGPPSNPSNTGSTCMLHDELLGKKQQYKSMIDACTVGTLKTSGQEYNRSTSILKLRQDLCTSRVQLFFMYNHTELLLRTMFMQTCQRDTACVGCDSSRPTSMCSMKGVFCV